MLKWSTTSVKLCLMLDKFQNMLDKPSNMQGKTRKVLVIFNNMIDKPRHMLDNSWRFSLKLKSFVFKALSHIN
ncbi:hypothetical protein DFO73_11214 [Cytobacillus oceanisediminis]|uniref:Uncharacterized protein n=1 Tax=Cytobacillus oceanisediminis TaxID=665099 RepID=A0A2V2ZTC1_9BACI|nr:hypothetical protein DFO73_11214 [Cytobacillus oceanisediminis]